MVPMMLDALAAGDLDGGVDGSYLAGDGLAAGSSRWWMGTNGICGNNYGDELGDDNGIGFQLC